MAKKQSKIYVPLDISLQFDSLEQLEKLETTVEFKDILFESVIEALNFVSKTKDPKISLFRIPTLDMVIVLSKKNYNKILDNMIIYYTEKDNFQRCIELTKLKKKL